MSSSKIVQRYLDNQCPLDGCAFSFINLLVFAAKKDQWLYWKKKEKKKRKSKCGKKEMIQRKKWNIDEA